MWLTEVGNEEMVSDHLALKWGYSKIQLTFFFCLSANWISLSIKFHSEVFCFVGSYSYEIWLSSGKGYIYDVRNRDKLRLECSL